MIPTGKTQDLLLGLRPMAAVLQKVHLDGF